PLSLHLGLTLGACHRLLGAGERLVEASLLYAQTSEPGVSARILVLRLDRREEIPLVLLRVAGAQLAGGEVQARLESRRRLGRALRERVEGARATGCLVAGAIRQRVGTGPHRVHGPEPFARIHLEPARVDVAGRQVERLRERLDGLLAFSVGERRGAAA